MFPLILNPVTSWRRYKLHALANLPLVKNPELVGPRIGLDVFEEEEKLFPPPGFEPPDRPPRSLVARLTTLYCLTNKKFL